jgi:hypothetical protein
MRTANERYRKWRANHPEKARANSRAYYAKNKSERKAYLADWRIKNKAKINQQRNERRANDPKFRIACALRTRLWQSIKQNTKKGSSVKDLGCSIPDLLKYLETKFQSGMAWENYGTWHIDHIKPLSLFDLENRKEFLKACNYSNLQPLWAKDNLSKGNR